jgi:hypothetical protein
MLMLSLSLAIARGLHTLAIWAVARSLNVPEPVVHDTGVFVVVQVQAFENRIGKALCPMRLFRQLRSWFR